LIIYILDKNLSHDLVRYKNVFVRSLATCFINF